MKSKKEQQPLIFICDNGHHYLIKGDCPFCGEKSVKKIKLRNGDCVFCGQLCIKGLYGCNSPVPESPTGRTMI